MKRISFVLLSLLLTSGFASDKKGEIYNVEYDPIKKKYEVLYRDLDYIARFEYPNENIICVLKNNKGQFVASGSKWLEFMPTEKISIEVKSQWQNEALDVSCDHYILSKSVFSSDSTIKYHWDGPINCVEHDGAKCPGFTKVIKS
jgi:hypothetical protein